jgi:hypothetical protein
MGTIRYVGKVRQMGDKIYVTVPAEQKDKVSKYLDKDMKVMLEEVWAEG